jgi:hypothetical protein
MLQGVRSTGWKSVVRSTTSRCADRTADIHVRQVKPIAPASCLFHNSASVISISPGVLQLELFGRHQVLKFSTWHILWFENSRTTTSCGRSSFREIFSNCCVFHHSVLRGGTLLSTQRGKGAKTREGQTVRVSDFRFPLTLGF